MVYSDPIWDEVTAQRDRLRATLQALYESVHRIEFAVGLNYVGELHQRMAEAKTVLDEKNI